MAMYELLPHRDAARILCNRDAAGGVITQGELARDVASLALQSELGGEQAALVLCRDRYQMLTACLAVWAAGGVVVLPPSDRPGLLADVVARSGARLALVDVAEDVPVERLVRVASPSGASHGEQAAPFRVAPEKRVVSLFTSGTTGTQQRVDKCARQLLGEATLLGEHFRFDEERTVVATVPAHHLYGLLFSLLVPFLARARFSRETPLQPHEVKEVIERRAASDLVTVPAHLRALCNAGTPIATSRAFSSGAVLDPELATRFEALSGARVFDVLGSTESGGIGVREPVRSLTYAPLPGIEVRAGADGLLALRSPLLPDPAAFTELPDRIRPVEDGFLYEGRGDGVIKVAGKRVSLQELEARARALPGVDDAAALVAPSELRERELWLIVATSAADWDEARVRHELAAHLEATLLPRRIKLVPALPRNSLGKLEQAAALGLFE